MIELCRLCASPSRRFGSLRSDPRVFFHCGQCESVFVSRADLLTPEEEKARYTQHNNGSTPQYRAFLSRLALPLSAFVPKGTLGLDFGCGPVPVMSEVLEALGYSSSIYDPFFFPDVSALSRSYAFITCSETAEHFHTPLKSFEQLEGLLSAGGILGVMTQMRETWEGFFEWHYPRDPTHVHFYSPQTMQWIAVRLGWSVKIESASVAIFQKPVSATTP